MILEPGANVARDAHVAARSADIRAQVGQDLTLHANRAKLSAAVLGDVHAATGHLELLPGAVIHGDLVVQGQAPDIAEGAQVLGRVQVSSGAEGWLDRPGLLGWLGRYGFILLGILPLGAAAIAFARPAFEHVTEPGDADRDRCHATAPSQRGVTRRTVGRACCGVQLS